MSAMDSVRKPYSLQETEWVSASSAARRLWKKPNRKTRISRRWETAQEPRDGGEVVVLRRKLT